MKDFWLRRWQGQRNWHEAYFLTLADPAIGLGAWLRLTINAQDGVAEAAQWAMLSLPGTDGVIARRVGHPMTIPAPRFGTTPDGGCEMIAGMGAMALTHAGSVGRFFDSQPPIEWELRWERAPQSVALLPYPWMYRAPWPATKLATLGAGLCCSGTLRVGETTYTIRRAAAHLGHTWGTRMAHSWAWAATGSFIEREGYCEVLSARVPIGPLVTPPLTVARLHVGDEVYRFDRWSGWLSQRSRWDRNGWELTAIQGSYRLRMRIRTSDRPIVGVTYRNPAGGDRYCHNTVGADADIELAERSAHGRSLRHRLTCRKTMAYEHVAPIPDPTLSLHL